MRILVAGASNEPVCGTRDSARTLAAALDRSGATVETAWWEIGKPVPKLPDADVVLWHYSPFTYATAGVPWRAASLLRAFGGTPVVTFFHELMFPWGLGRGAIFAAAQRAALVPILRASRGAVVTTEDRRDWLRARTGIPVLFTPVVSNIARAGAVSRNGGPRIGVFGFRREHVPVEVVAQAVAAVPGATLALVGAPGPQSAEAEAWRTAAKAAGVAVEFSGVVGERELSAALESLDVVVFPDVLGPTTRRGTLAAALAHARPVVGFDGEQTWRPFVDEHAVDVVPVSAYALGERLRTLVADDTLRAERSRCAAEFHARRLDPDVVARELLAFLEDAAGG